MKDRERLDGLIEAGMAFTFEEAIAVHARSKMTRGSEFWNQPPRRITTEFKTGKAEWFQWKTDAETLLLSLFKGDHPIAKRFSLGAQRKIRSIDKDDFLEAQAMMIAALRSARLHIDEDGSASDQARPHDAALTEVRDEIRALLALSPGGDQDRLGRATGVRVRALHLVELLYGQEAPQRRSLSTLTRLGGTWKEARRCLEDTLGILDTVKRDLDMGIVQWPGHATDHIEPPRAIVLRLLRRFHLVAAQIRRRRQGARPVMEMTDEYDVQDLLHSLLYLHFGNIKAEEPTPSFISGSAKIDFLLPGTGIGIEVKRIRPKLTARKVGDELIEDMARYRAHPECNHLICFIYDPDGTLDNPGGLIDDLTKHSREDFTVDAVVSPEAS